MDRKTILDAGAAKLHESKVASPRACAEFLLSSIEGVSRGELLADLSRPVAAGAGRTFQSRLARLRRGLPLAYVLGSREFLGLPLAVAPGVLIPRPETEELVQYAAAFFEREQAVRILDVGTGSGNIAIGLARLLPKSSVLALDISPDALKIARKNARSWGVSHRTAFSRGTLFRLPRGLEPFDMLISNPPYIPTARLGALDRTVRREPRLALDGGPDGLRHLRAIIAQAPGLLKRAGVIALEIDDGQGTPALELLKCAGFNRAEVRRDLGGQERFAFGRWA